MRTILLSALLLAAHPPRPLQTHELQTAVDAEVARLAADPDTSLVMIAVVDPAGAVLALGGQRGATVDRTLPEQTRRDPGSVMKTFTIGAALEAGLMTPASTVAGEGGHWTFGGRTIDDASPHQTLSVDDVMAFSSNVGTAKIFTRLGHERLEATLRAVGLPAPAMPDDESAVGVSFGADITPTPLELARAYAAIASGRVFPSKHAEVMTLLRHTVERKDGTGHGARIDGVSVAGKTGTYPQDDGGRYGDFVGIVPAEAPRFIILVGVESRAAGYTGGTVAAPAFARLGAKLLR